MCMYKTSKSFSNTGVATSLLQLRIRLVWHSHARLNCVNINFYARCDRSIKWACPYSNHIHDLHECQNICCVCVSALEVDDGLIAYGE